ncbi:MAG: Holliday junction resolvase RuvX [Myxococcales bacterium]|nr:Holliday junction resolvase RuvX [Myxococcales bacterium]
MALGVVQARRMRAAAIDLGTVRVGLAVADDLGLLAHPRPFLNGKDKGKLIAELGRLAQEEGIERFLVGLPRRLDGREGPEAKRARQFAAKLRAATGVAVEMIDEWLSTREAAARLRERGVKAREARAVVDSEAAALLLQSWLDGRQHAP